jgi:hypothetical protein
LEARRVGIILPTYNRPDLLRACVLQMAAQSRPPDVVCVHQNGHPEPYTWAVADLRIQPRVDWIHTPQQIPQHQWYAIPLRHLLQQGCTHFFWTDHDDLYMSNHIEAGLAELAGCDFSVALHCGVLTTRGTEWRHVKDIAFTTHAPGGMSSTMCFNRPFATQLLHDLVNDTQHYYSDNVVAHVTMPKFRCLVSTTRRTAIYHAHEGSLTSRDWLDGTFRSQ